MVRFSVIWHWFVGVGIVICVIGITIPFVQANDTPVSEEANSPDNKSEVAPTTKVESQQEIPVSGSPRVAIDPSDKIELQQLFNDLRKEYLDARSESVNWWLEFIAIVLAFFGLIIVIAGYIGFREFRRLRDEAESDADEIKNHLSKVLESGAELERVREEAEVSEARAESDEVKQRMRETLSAEVFATLTNDEEFEKTLRDFEEVPNLPFIDKAMVEAYKLQKDGKITEAIQKWRSIANIVDEADKNLAARAWNSVGYLFSGQGRSEDAISAYDKAIEMRADYAEAYYNRGFQKAVLDQSLDAIEDLDKAIALNFNEAKAHIFRGLAKFKLDKHDEAFTDFDRAICMKPDFAVAYATRGLAKARLNDIVGAKVDLQIALGLAKEQDEKELIDELEKDLQELNETE